MCYVRACDAFVTGTLSATKIQTRIYGKGRATDKKLPELADKKVFKNVMPFIPFVRAAMAEKGRDALALVLPFDETATLVTNVAYLQKALKLEEVTIKALTDCTDAKLAMQGKPGDPVSVFAA